MVSDLSGVQLVVLVFGLFMGFYLLIRIGSAAVFRSWEDHLRRRKEKMLKRLTQPWEQRRD